MSKSRIPRRGILNLLKLTELTRVAFLGSWCCKEAGISFVAFYRNVCSVPGLLQNVVNGMVLRECWAAEKVLGADWNASFQRTLDEKQRMLLFLPGEGDRTFH